MSTCGYSCNVWNLETGQLIDIIVLDLRNVEDNLDFQNVEDDYDYRYSYISTPDGQTMVTTLNRDYGPIIVSNMLTGEIVSIITTFMEYSFRCFATSSDGRTLVCGGIRNANNCELERSIKVWDVQTERIACTLYGGHTGKVERVLISSNGQILVSLTCSNDSLGMHNLIKVWNLPTGQELCTFNMPLGIHDSILYLFVSLDGQTVVSGTTQGSIKVWDIHTQQVICTLQGGVPITFNSDTKILVSYAEANNDSGYVTGRMLESSRIKVWDVQTGQEIWTLPGFFPITLSRDGKLLVSGGTNYTIKVWDVQTGQELCILPGHPSSLDRIVISPDGQTIVSYGMNTSSFNDASIKVWGVR